MNSSAPSRQYYPALDGLRGIAIIMVVIFHNFNFTNYFFFGWLGVDLFFVLSGLDQGQSHNGCCPCSSTPLGLKTLACVLR